MFNKKPTWKWNGRGKGKSNEDKERHCSNMKDIAEANKWSNWEIRSYRKDILLLPYLPKKNLALFFLSFPVEMGSTSQCLQPIYWNDLNLSASTTIPLIMEERN